MAKDVVVIKCGDHLLRSWVDNMAPLLPRFEVVPYNTTPRVDNVTYVIGWRPDARWINGFPNLKAVVSIGSGVDHILHLDELRPDLPVIRTVSSDLVQRMREFVVLCVLAWHRQLPQMLQNALIAKWHRYTAGTANTINVGIMGYGAMGSAVAAALNGLGYSVAVWARSPRSDTALEYFCGPDQLSDFVARTDVLVCMLPLTKATEGILAYDLLKRLRPGGCLVNVGRGAHLVDSDLLRAIGEGHISAAFLDVFRDEPLPPDSPLWTAPGVYPTCHSAAYISPEAGPKIIAENIKRFDSGLPVSPLYDRSLGY